MLDLNCEKEPSKQQTEPNEPKGYLAERAGNIDSYKSNNVTRLPQNALRIDSGRNPNICGFLTLVW